jgi:hypothetical protein
VAFTGLWRRRQAREVDVGKPFHHQVIVNILRDEFFQKPKSAGIVHKSSFVSKHPTRGEIELPAPMVALVATAVCSSFYIYSAP